MFGKHGFPSEITDDPLLDLVLAAPEAHPNAEERRLLYVAITRARRQVYLLAEGGPPSSFARELLHGRYEVNVFGRQAVQRRHPLWGDVAQPTVVGNAAIKYAPVDTGKCGHLIDQIPIGTIH